jgi:type I restriction enzyme, S subunit
MPHLNSSILSALPVLVPPTSEQQAIAEVLDSLDETIQVNERLHDQCHDQASTFLTRLLDTAKSDSTLQHGRLRDVAALNIQNVTPGAGTLRYLDISAVGMGRAAEPTAMQWADAPRRARRAVKDGDVLWSTVRPNRKAHCLVIDPAPDLVVSTAVAVLTPVSVGPSFLYGITEQPEFVDYLVSVAKGTTYPEVHPERFLQASLPLPSRDALASFEESTMPLRRRAASALNESRKLAALRDTLLPPLLSGQLREHDAEVLAEEVVRS